MDISPLVPGATRAAGSAISAAVGRYRPIGVVRVGSAEDRAQAYRRFLDAAAHFVVLVGTINRMHHEGGEAAEPHIQEVLPDTRHAGNEVLAALDGIRVCAPDYVIDQAEAAAQSFPNVDLEPEAFSKAGALYLKKKALFIDSVRRDLAYGAAWWQLWRKAKEKWFVWRHYSEQKQSDAGEPESAPVSAVRPGGS